MRKIFLVLMTAAFLLGACQGKQNQESGSTAPVTPDPNGELKKTLAADPGHDELVRLAKAEGALTVYSVGTWHQKLAAAFGEKYGITINFTQLSDGQMSEKVAKEASANVAGADVIFTQDAGRAYSELYEPEYVLNYVPPAVRALIPPQYHDPLTWAICIKTFLYNSEKSEAQPIQNIWEVTEPEWKGRIQLKDPFTEGVNMNFLTMLTKSEHAEKLSRAYKSRYGKDIVLTTPNAGYEWIKAFFSNELILGSSDTRIAEAIGAKGQPTQLMALVTLNKARLNDAKGLVSKTVQQMEPYAGFWYPIFGFVPSNTRNVNAAKLFIDYCFSDEGFNVWTQLGDYSTNPKTVNPNDPNTLDQWNQWLLGEDPRWLSEHRTEVEEFLNSFYSK
jgi:iron(III) transport system substrate-binding protein